MRSTSPPHEALLAARHPSGGWGWRANQTPNTECTALAVWALHREPNHDAAAVAAGLRWLHEHQLDDGSWPLSEQVTGSSWATSLAVLALAAVAPGDTQAHSGAAWLLGQRNGRPGWVGRLWLRFFLRDRAVDQDPNLIGWPWTADAAAWVEPTSWALLAIRSLSDRLPAPLVRERTEQAERLFADRMCVGGGWNYGNKRVMGEDLPPYPDTTALALISLQQSQLPEVTGASRDRLREMLRTNRTGLVLALSILAFQVYGDHVSALRADLRAVLATGRLDDDVRVLALAALALYENEPALRIGSHA